MQPGIEIVGDGDGKSLIKARSGRDELEFRGDEWQVVRDSMAPRGNSETQMCLILDITSLGGHVDTWIRTGSQV